MDILPRTPLNLTDVSAPSTSSATDAAGSATDAGIASGAASGGCGCCAPAQTTKTPAVTAEAVSTVDTEYFVDGLTCGSCAGRVSSAISALDGVGNVQIALVPGGTSTVSVTSNQPLTRVSVQDAVEKAGYQLTNA